MSDRFLAGKRAARMKDCLCILLVRVDLMFDCGIIQVIVSGKKKLSLLQVLTLILSALTQH